MITPVTPPLPLQPAELKLASILLVDDDVALAEALSEALQSQGHVVTAASTTVEALCKLMAVDYDVILCDMMMPRMTGHILYMAVRQLKPHLCPRFLFLTGNGDHPKVKAFLQRVNGAVAFKPVLTRELLRMIANVHARRIAA